MTLWKFLDLLTVGIRRKAISSSSVRSSGQGKKPPLPTGKTAVDMCVLAVFFSVGNIDTLREFPTVGGYV